MKTLSFNKILLIIIVLVALVNITLLINFLMKRNRTTEAQSPALALTMPVTTFMGTVKEKNANTLVVTSNGIDVTVTIDSTVPVTIPPQFIPYSFKTDFPKEQKGDLESISVGQTISINTQEDIRTITKPVVKAKSIITQAQNRQISGQVESKTANTLVIKGMVMPTDVFAQPKADSKPASPQSYTVSITADTELSRTTTPTNGLLAAPTKITLNDVAQGANVNVYYAPGTSDNTVTGLLVQVLPNVTEAIQAPATSSASAVTEPIVGIR